MEPGIAALQADLRSRRRIPDSMLSEVLKKPEDYGPIEGPVNKK
jgi:hypothetical protein